MSLGDDIDGSCCDDDDGRDDDSTDDVDVKAGSARPRPIPGPRLILNISASFVSPRINDFPGF